MASLLDDLKGILGDDAIAKIEANPALKSRVEKGSELVTMYFGDDDPDPVTPPANRSNEPPPAPRSVPGAGLDLSAVERMLDTKLGSINTTIDTKLGELVNARGTELLNNAVKIALQRSDELNRVYNRHSAEFGEVFDSVKFNEFLETPEAKAKNFQSVTQAYEAWVAPRLTQKAIDKGIEDGIKAKSGSSVPGTTPAPSTNNTITFFRKRGTAAEGGATTGAQRAAAILDQKLNAGAA